MPKKRSWTIEQLKEAVRTSPSRRQVLVKLGLRSAGGNYAQLKQYIKEYNLSTDHFKGKAWNKGMKFPHAPKIHLKEILVKGSTYQSFKLKNRLFQDELKPKHCEECGWAQSTSDGYLPLELDHINGDRMDNRLENLRILCPNCHSLKPTHRGRNKKKGVVFI
ncbi:HNH endonuclease [Patescibacteria group bacterium]|nr:HNH endonuclease [Patescibacteria group bacterium]